MFDAATSTLFQAAPALADLPNNEIGSLISRTYAAIFAERLKTRADDAQSNDVLEAVSRLRRLGSSMEALVAASLDRPNVKAAAFVGATAHLVATSSLRNHNAAPRSFVGVHSISSDLAGVLLYLAAESPADAVEMTRQFNIPVEVGVERSLFLTISNIATGRLQAVVGQRVPDADIGQRSTSEFSEDELAVRELYRRILILLQRCASCMILEQTTQRSSVSPSNFDEELDGIRALCVETWTSPLDLDKKVMSVYAGPLHLATLLKPAIRFLLESSLVAMDKPESVSDEAWGYVVERLAGRRPYLWPNHRQAIEQGLLQQGTSSVVSFPTGAGKSTLSELKIATTLAAGKKVVFLAPTLALVDQTHDALTRSFPDVALESDDMFDLLGQEEPLQSITVMTPEKFLAHLAFTEEAFSDVGLLVFDECHLIHPKQGGRNTRAIDAMLAILLFSSLVPNADLLLLSAMIDNSEELSAWLQELTGRPTVPLTGGWKPTRQVRGCVVYDSTEIQELREYLAFERMHRTQKAPPKDVKEQLLVRPMAVFGLHALWESNEFDDYALIPLLDGDIQLAAAHNTRNANSWYLTPNANKVAAAIAGAASSSGVKTLVFGENVVFVSSISTSIVEILPSRTVLMNSKEVGLFRSALEELGAVEALYADVDASHLSVISTSLPHHSLLLPAERLLHESLFSRSDGINVLAATSTLAQGMNLPASLVIIAGDTRYDDTNEMRQNVAAHELLNAAGRAGRAGENSYGMVLLIPGQIVSATSVDLPSSNSWHRVQSVFSMNDQCLTIQDPLEDVLDRVLTMDMNPDADYVLRRLAPTLGAEETVDRVETIVRRTLSSYRARSRGDREWIDQRVAAVKRAVARETNDVSNYLQMLAAGAGVPLESLQIIKQELDTNSPSDAVTVSEAAEWLIAVLSKRPELLESMSRGRLADELSVQPDDVSGSADEAALNAATRWACLRLWMGGSTLQAIEARLADSLGKKPDVRCKRARAFVMRFVRDVSFIFGFPGKIMAMEGSTAESEDGEFSLPMVWEHLGQCVKHGFDDPVQFALWIAADRTISRPRCHAYALSLEGFAANPGESFQQTVARFRTNIEHATDLL
ncbi:DEAD/DEAH box helicase [Paenarthrobacter nitroguajacolicus]|uniref:DEAD/DEAH box helicase n=1 Tax=Paenarthrobacter nitroguajacolicus TaxID=211146 RepID=UPI0015BB8455|nr:DEAD/DEAH box helicase [Paenarthrobacter nitroguajacolicus]NWL33261.1 hypothetical protein [Paenarthrobacter nitroguajacolicus]